MKPIFKCEYCDKIGVAEEIEIHEETCIYNYSKKSCFTCKYSKNKITKFSCELGKNIPEGMMFENCPFYEWDEKIRNLDNSAAFSNIFGSIFR